MWGPPANKRRVKIGKEGQAIAMQTMRTSCGAAAAAGCRLSWVVWEHQLAARQPRGLLRRSWIGSLLCANISHKPVLHARPA